MNGVGSAIEGYLLVIDVSGVLEQNSYIQGVACGHPSPDSPTLQRGRARRGERGGRHQSTRCGG